MTARRPGPLLNHYLRGMAKSIQGWEGTEETYSGVFDQYEAQYGKGWLADVKAGSDPQILQARGDGGWYRDRAQTYALGALVLMLHEHLYEQKGTPS